VVTNSTARVDIRVVRIDLGALCSSSSISCDGANSTDSAHTHPTVYSSQRNWRAIWSHQTQSKKKNRAVVEIFLGERGAVAWQSLQPCLLPPLSLKVCTYAATHGDVVVAAGHSHEVVWGRKGRDRLVDWLGRPLQTVGVRKQCLATMSQVQPPVKESQACR
jgi:hypothetical protein